VRGADRSDAFDGSAATGDLPFTPNLSTPQSRERGEPIASAVERGLSPHAPYSVHPELFARLIDLAKAHSAPVAMHLAETRAELELLAQGRGEFVEMLTAFGVWRDGLIPRGSRPMDYLKRLAEVARALVVHGNYLDEDELEFVAIHPQMTVVYCPRTHAFFGHAPHPWRRLLDRGASVALGTDSRASNPDLSLWNELTFLREEFPDAAPRVLLELGTIRGARALGLDGEFGTIAPGKSARLATVALPNAMSDPWNALFAGRIARLDLFS
jgi:cytosine/adenosine deaminase-related metal-dependent hydrolase